MILPEFRNIPRSVLLLVGIVVLVGLVIRWANLGQAGFAGDEETTSLASISVARGDGPHLPSGLAYHRALPQTYANAVVANLAGTGEEASYRVVSALFGSLTVLSLFVLGSRLIGGASAAIATTFLALSDWHIEMSRTARMYSPLLFFCLVFAFSLVMWHRNKHWACYWVSVLSFAAAATLHLISITLLPLYVAPLLFARVRIGDYAMPVATAAALGGAAILFDRLVVTSQFRLFRESLGVDSAAPVANTLSMGESLVPDGNMTAVLLIGAAGLVLGAWTGKRTMPFVACSQNRVALLAVLASCFVLGLSAAAGSISGTVTAGLILGVQLRVSPATKIRTLALPIAVIAAFLIAWTAMRVLELGPIEAIKAGLSMPFPYVLEQLRLYPGFFALVLLSAIVSVFLAVDDRTIAVRAVLLVFFAYLLALGLGMDWAPPRYFAQFYPLLLLAGSFVLLKGAKALVTAIRPSSVESAPALAVVLVASGVLGAHGLPQAFAHVGSPYGRTVFGDSVPYPDHQSLGCFVRANLSEGDIVVAEDALQQAWYVGTVDYWLRSPESHGAYAYTDLDGVERDIYVGSRVTTDPAIRQLSAEADRRIWLITSGETRGESDFYLGVDTPQRAWLDGVTESEDPVTKGRDGLSAVYCLNCLDSATLITPAEGYCASAIAFQDP